MISPEWLEGAARRLHSQIAPTLLMDNPELNLCPKWKNRQRTGSFKINGALQGVFARKARGQQ